MATPLVNLERILAGVQLPALPHSAIRLLELSRNPAVDVAEFAAPIEADPGLTGQVLRFVNSSYFGFSREISSVKLAITLVGIRTIKNFVLWSAVFSLVPNPRCGPFDLKSLWQDSLRRALFAREMAKLLGVKEAEEAFAAALLQDMAVPLLAKEVPDLYTKLLLARHDGQIRLSFLEENLFGWHHGQVGAKMARHWKLPETLAALIESHQAVDRWVQNPRVNAEKLAVSLSALLPTMADSLWSEGTLFEHYYRKALPAGGPAVSSLLELTDRQFAEFAPLLKLDTPAKSLVDSYQKLAAVGT